MQEVIVYRNPAEAAVWGAIMSPVFGAVLAGMFALLTVLLLVDAVLRKFEHPIFRRMRGEWNVPTWLSCAAGLFVAYKLWPMM